MDRASDSGPETTLAIVLGADRWPAWPALDSEQFTQSAAIFTQYLLHSLGIPETRVLDLFNDDRPQDEIVQEISRFLRRQIDDVSDERKRPTTLITYYVGHGSVGESGGSYRLLIPRSREHQVEASSLSVSMLDSAFREAARGLQRLLIIDACFAGGAADAFRSPEKTQGTSLFVAVNRSRAASSAGGRATRFTDALLTVLERGDPRLGERLTLRQVAKLTRDVIGALYGDAAAKPEVHSPEQPHDDLADQGVFPNPAHWRAKEARASSASALPAKGPWCAVLSGVDGKPARSGSLRDVVSNVYLRFRGDIARATDWNFPNAPTFHTPEEVLRSAYSFQLAVDAVCQADLAFFDLTEYEPVVMLLLGIRSVIRRGVTVCSVGRIDQLSPAVDLPFSLKEINTALHGTAMAESNEDLVDIFGKRVLKGIEQLSRAPERYADLPPFQTIREPSLDRTPKGILPYHEQALILCPFSSEYTQRTWRELRHRLVTALKAQMDQDPDAGHSSPRIVRTLDMESPRLIGSGLFEAIRITDFCLVDLTEWRANVLFELGVRLAANELEPVCIYDPSEVQPMQPRRRGAGKPSNSPTAALSQRQRSLEFSDQYRRLLELLRALEYQPDDQDAYARMVEQHLKNRDLAASAELQATWARDSQLPPGSIYHIAWQHAMPTHESAGRPVVELLEDSAIGLTVDEQQGRSPFVYPKEHELTRAAERNGRERLVAAWLYLHYRLGDNALLGDPEKSSSYIRLSEQLAKMLLDSPESADQILADEIFDASESFKAKLRDVGYDGK